MTHLLTAAVLAASAQALIYAGLAFINAKLLPELFAPVYAVTAPWHRLLIHTVFAGLPANWLLPHVYDIVNPGVAGAAILTTLVLVLATKAALLENAQPDVRTVAAITVTAASAAWMAAELHRISVG